MLEFEQELLKRGYLKFVYNVDTKKYKPAGNHILSSMGYVSFRYFHKDDKVILQKIADGVMVNNGITFEDRKGEIYLGLREYGMPPTLIYPRPRILVKKIINGNVVILNEDYDESMNLVLERVSFDDIFKAMYDMHIVFRFDITNEGDKIVKIH